MASCNKPWKLYPGDDERRGEVCAADQAQAPVDLAAVAAQRHHEGVQAPHAARRDALTRQSSVRDGNTRRSVR